MDECVSGIVDGAFVVETWSGDDNNVICSIRGQPPIRHYVRVENLRAYPAKKVKCKGSIDSDEPVVLFESNNPNDTATVWTAQIVNFASLAEHTFSPCLLRAVDGAFGKEDIRTFVRVEWYGPQPSLSIPQKITVTTD